ncbi:MAG: hypothetical protein HRT45_11610 [Bdellovibrionales bacterium]|nr:hypothetical protein [Bdellovibrionales bacterium]
MAFAVKALVLLLGFGPLLASASMTEFYVDRIECVNAKQETGYCILFGPLKDRIPTTPDFPSAHQSGDALIVDASELEGLYVQGFSEADLNEALGKGAVNFAEARFFRDSKFIAELKAVSPLYFYRDLRTKHIAGVSLDDVFITEQAIENAD